MIKPQVFERNNSGFRKEQYDISVTNINVTGINWWDILNEEGLTAGTMTMSDSRIKVYLNRSLPASTQSKVGNYPHQLLMKAKLPVKVAKIDVNGLDLSYEEYNRLISIFFPLIILCDINLPGQTGLQFKKQIDNDDELRQQSIPFVFISTNASREPVTEAYTKMTVQVFSKSPQA